MAHLAASVTWGSFLGVSLPLAPNYLGVCIIVPLFFGQHPSGGAKSPHGSHPPAGSSCSPAQILLPTVDGRNPAGPPYILHYHNY